MSKEIEKLKADFNQRIDNLYEQHEKIKADFQSQLDALKAGPKKPEIDWNQWVGKPIYSWDGDDRPDSPYISLLTRFNPNHPSPFQTPAGAVWKHAEPYIQETIWHDWHGGECPVPEGKWAVVQLRNGEIDFRTDPDKFPWNWICREDLQIVLYTIIDPPEEDVW